MENMGKLADKELKTLLSCIKKDARVIVPPTVGFDSGVHFLDDECVVVSTDPCVGAPKDWFGWLLINYAASDVAVFGAKPQYATINLLAPRGTKSIVFEKAMKQACRASDELEMVIITGHTGTYDGLSTLVGTCTAYGIIKQSDLITPAGAKLGDLLVCVKPLGFETLVNLALTNKKLANRLFGYKQAQFLAQEVKMQTCVNEALVLAQTGGVSAMHDATEGGFVAALNEIADASNIGFSVDFAELLILPELRKLAEHFELSWQQILSISSTGTLLVAVSPSHTEKIAKNLSKLQLSCKVVGVFEGNKRRIKLDGKEIDFPEVADDPYAEILGRG
jgi:hydrogenase expression/formation protein HypE